MKLELEIWQNVRMHRTFEIDITLEQLHNLRKFAPDEAEEFISQEVIKTATGSDYEIDEDQGPNTHILMMIPSFPAECVYDSESYTIDITSKAAQMEFAFNTVGLDVAGLAKRYKIADIENQSYDAVGQAAKESIRKTLEPLAVSQLATVRDCYRQEYENMYSVNKPHAVACQFVYDLATGMIDTWQRDKTDSLWLAAKLRGDGNV